MKKILALVLALTLVAGLFSFASAEGAKKKIGIAMPTKELERWNNDGDFLCEVFSKWMKNLETSPDEKSRLKAYELFDSGFIDNIEVGTVKGLQQMHAYIKQ